MKTLFAPHLNRNVKMGRRAPLVRPQTFRLASYLLAGLPTAPPSSDYTAAALQALRDIMGNDQWGDCVEACMGHLVGTETGNAGDLFHATLAQIEALYTALTGFNPAIPSTDQGTNMADAMNYIVKTGFPNGTKALGYLSVNPSNAAEVQAAMWLFENLVFGVSLPDTYVNPFPSADGFTWGPGTADPSNGHCFLGVGYTTAGVTIDTWGLFGTFTYAAIAELCAEANGGELYVVLTPDQIAKAATKAPNGVDWASIVADFDSIGGQVPIPSTAPPVVPTPAPGTAVTLAQAQSWATAGISEGLPLLTRAQAEADASAGLAANWPKS